MGRKKDRCVVCGRLRTGVTLWCEDCNDHFVEKKIPEVIDLLSSSDEDAPPPSKPPTTADLTPTPAPTKVHNLPTPAPANPTKAASAKPPKRAPTNAAPKATPKATPKSAAKATPPKVDPASAKPKATAAKTAKTTKSAKTAKTATTKAFTGTAPMEKLASVPPMAAPQPSKPAETPSPVDPLPDITKTVEPVVPKGVSPLFEWQPGNPLRSRVFEEYAYNDDDYPVLVLASPAKRAKKAKKSKDKESRPAKRKKRIIESDDEDAQSPAKKPAVAPAAANPQNAPANSSEVATKESKGAPLMPAASLPPRPVVGDEGQLWLLLFQTWDIVDSDGFPTGGRRMGLLRERLQNRRTAKTMTHRKKSRTVYSSGLVQNGEHVRSLPK
ncbi:hypothetical protein ACHHYP_05957 [Achlya hypogyna]|uniref:Uncharacterized protein n=1 Tax=Achlya hypogyna TaxID=1202772 RepID=A0A1V9YW67_ACHHY|nr:hypothetical protein ACHHYP_05957 [Achlya hypogyna]